ncbi:MAG: ABC transporter permease [Pirellulales bacterium]
MNFQNTDGYTKPFPSSNVTIIIPRKGLRALDWKGLYEFRDLFFFLVFRDVRIRYAQSVLGVGWAIIQPVFSMLVFTVVFGRLAQVSSDGEKYSLFALAALVPWTYFANAVLEGVNSLITNANMISKVYFPRVILPLSAVCSRLFDLLIALTLLLIVLVFNSRLPNWGILLLPYLILILAITAAGLSMWCASLAVQYRDVKYAMAFGIQLLMYLAPVVYPASLVPTEYQSVYAINPLVGVIEGFRSSLLGTREMPWGLIAIGSASAACIAASGLIYFQSRERLIADVA